MLKNDKCLSAKITKRYFKIRYLIILQRVARDIQVSKRQLSGNILFLQDMPIV